jgi:uncharacterized protein (DUF2141 family)
LALVSGVAAASEEISNDLSRCAAGKGPAVLVNVQGVKEARGNVRVQSYAATPGTWLAKGRWLHRIESRASAGNMSFCLRSLPKGDMALLYAMTETGMAKQTSRRTAAVFPTTPA